MKLNYCGPQSLKYSLPGQKRVSWFLQVKEVGSNE